MIANNTPEPDGKPADTQRSAGCALTPGSRIPTREDAPIVDSSWDDDSDEDDDDTTDFTKCGMHYDDGHNFACELIGSEQCEFCPNRR